jgi:hypothetical protein
LKPSYQSIGRMYRSGTDSVHGGLSDDGTESEFEARNG